MSLLSLFLCAFLPFCFVLTKEGLVPAVTQTNSCFKQRPQKTKPLLTTQFSQLLLVRGFFFFERPQHSAFSMGRFSLVAVAAICVLAASSKVRFFPPVQREISTFFRDNSRVLLQLGKLLQFLVFRFSSEERSPTAPRRGKAPLLAFLSSRRWRAAPLAHF